MFKPLSILVALLAGPTTPEAPPLSWSPDGAWIAYVSATAPAERTLQRLDLFRAAPDPPARPSDAHGLVFRLWATRLADRRSVLIDSQTQGTISAPAWTRDGRSLIYARLVRDGPGTNAPHARELVIAYPDDCVVIHRQALPRPLTPFEKAGFASQAVALAPDERYALVPSPNGHSIDQIDLESGALVRTLAPARHASWSPDGRWIAYLRPLAADRAKLVLVRAEGEPQPRSVATLRAFTQPPVWTSDGERLLALRLEEVEKGARTALIAHDPERNRTKRLKTVEGTIETPKTIRVLNLAVDPSGLMQYFLVGRDEPGQTDPIAVHQGRMPMTRIFPLGAFGRIDAVTLAPDGRHLAFRFAAGARERPVGVQDTSIRKTRISPFQDTSMEHPVAVMSLSERRLEPLTPDADATAAWLAVLGAVAPPLEDPEARPSRIPFHPEQARPADRPGGDRPKRLDRVSELGLELLERFDRQDGANALDVAHAEALFRLLAGQVEEAAEALELINAATVDPRRRARLLGLIAQLAMDQGHELRAEEIVRYLKATDRRATALVMPDGLGGLAIEEIAPSRTWTEALERALLEPEAVDDDQAKSHSSESNSASSEADTQDTEMTPPIHPAEQQRLQRQRLLRELLRRRAEEGRP